MPTICVLHLLCLSITNPFCTLESGCFSKVCVDNQIKLNMLSLLCFVVFSINRGDGVVVRASALQSVDLGFIPLVESYQKTLKNGIHSFPAWRSAFMGGCGEQAGKFACCVLGQGT